MGIDKVLKILGLVRVIADLIGSVLGKLGGSNEKTPKAPDEKI